jgi:hypothetical protein
MSQASATLGTNAGATVPSGTVAVGASRRALVVHRRAGSQGQPAQWLALLAQGAGESFRVSETWTVPDGPQALAQILSRAPGAGAGGGGTLVHLLAPGATMLRPLPAAAAQLPAKPDEALATLELIAEAQLPDSLPEHRRGAGVLRSGGARAPYAIGWPQSAGAGGTEALAWPAGTVHVPAPVCAWALHRALLPGGGLVAVVQRTGDMLLCASVPGAGDGALLLRALRDEPGDGVELATVVRDAVADAGEALEASFDVPGAIGPGLLTSGRGRTVAGLGEGKQEDFALLAGAALAVLDTPPAEAHLVAGLLGMAAVSPVQRRAWPVRVCAWLGTPGRVLGAACVAVALLLAGSMGASALRAWAAQRALQASAASPEAFATALEQQSWQSLLRERRWPVSHLLSQLVAGQPAGVLIESMTLEVGKPVVLTAVAPSAEAINEWRSALAGSRTFADVAVPQQTPLGDASGSVRFTLTAKVDQPLATIKASERLVPAPAPAAPAVATVTPAATPGAAAPARTGGATGTANRRAGTPATGTGARGAQAPAGEAPGAPSVPEALSESAIGAMELGPARVQWARRRGPSQNMDLDDAVRTRLARELELLQQRIDALNAQRTGGGGS